MWKSRNESFKKKWIMNLGFGIRQVAKLSTLLLTSYVVWDKWLNLSEPHFSDFEKRGDNITYLIGVFWGLSKARHG